MILCNARAMGEFGAVSVVSGHIRGQTNTMPLHVEILYNEYQFAAAFAVASLLALLALVTLVIKSYVEWQASQLPTGLVRRHEHRGPEHRASPSAASWRSTTSRSISRRDELIALLGPSGCGKTTLLRIIAGLEFPDAGRVLFDGEDASDRDVRERQVGFVFQHYALFRHMTVFENIAFGLRVKPQGSRPSEAEIKREVGELLELVQLGWLAHRYPTQLSGGQRQRIALARALAVEPRVLLLDEPFGALDAKVRKELRRWLRRLHDELHITSIFVTHDQDEALEVADRIVLMNKGRIEQIGTAQEVYERPATAFAYSFLGAVNRFAGRVDGHGLRVGKDACAAREAGRCRRRGGGCLCPSARARHRRRRRCRPGAGGQGQPRARQRRDRARGADRPDRQPTVTPSRSTSRWS